MALEDDQINWRTVFQPDKTKLKCTNTPDGTTEQPVKQVTAASLKCTNTPDGTTEQPVKQATAASLKCTNTPDGTTTQPVVQATPANLKCTNTPDGTTTQPVVQATPANLKCTNTPDGTTAQPVVQPDNRLLKCTVSPDQVTPYMVTQYQGVRGIWPTSNAVRVNASDFQAGVGVNDVYTVPADKILFIANCSLASYETADALSNCRMGIKDENDAWVAWLIYIYYAIAGQLTVPQQYSPAIEAAALYDVYIESSNANIGCRGQFYGWLEDV